MKARCCASIKCKTQCKITVKSTFLTKVDCKLNGPCKELLLTVLNVAVIIFFFFFWFRAMERVLKRGEEACAGWSGGVVEGDQRK